MFHVEFDKGRWEETIRKLAAVNRTTVQKQLRLTARLVVEEAMAMTPPIPGKGFGKGNAGIKERRAAGNRATALDIGKTMMPVKNLFVVRNTDKDNRAGKYLRRYLRAGNSKAAETILRNLEMGMKGEIHPTAQRFMHENQRFNGKVNAKRAKRYYVMQGSTITAYIKERQKQVWKGVSGWNRAATALKVRPRYWPAAAKKHTQPGLYRESPKSSNDVFFEFANKSAYMQGKGRDLNIMRNAFRGVEGRMVKDLEVKLTMAHKQSNI